MEAAVRSIRAVSGSQSTRIGIALAWRTAIAVAIKVLAGMIISSPGLMPQAWSPRAIASVPQATPTPYFTPEAAANAVSNSASAWPKIKSPSSIIFLIASDIWDWIGWCCREKFTNGTLGGR